MRFLFGLVLRAQFSHRLWVFPDATRVWPCSPLIYARYSTQLSKAAAAAAAHTTNIEFHSNYSLGGHTRTDTIADTRKYIVRLGRAMAIISLYVKAVIRNYKGEFSCGVLLSSSACVFLVLPWKVVLTTIVYKRHTNGPDSLRYFRSLCGSWPFWRTIRIG